MKSRTFSLIIVLAVFVGLVAGLIFASNFNWTTKGVAADESESEAITLGSDEPVPQEVLNMQATSKAFVYVAKTVSPAVVTINSEKVVKRRPWHPFMNDEFFRRFFQFPEQEQEQILRGLGSGVIVNAHGYILTNNHVIEDADAITVTVKGKEYEAEIVGKDPASDIAVIKIDKDDLPTVKLGNSDELEVGEWVLAIGNPFSDILQNTVTAGIVSAKGRTGLNIGGGRISYQDFIQTDAAINPGNSGGALVNLKGELVGINTAIVGQANVGIGFAIPINLARSVMEQLISKGRVIRGWLGVYIDDINEDVAKGLGLESAKGVQVPRVQEDSPAEKAGVKAGDIILKVNDKVIENADQLRNYIASLSPGTEVDLTIWRDGKEKIITVKLGERPSEQEMAKGETIDVAREKLGLTVQNLTDELAKRFGFEDEKGVLVADVRRGSPADREGIKVGDLIVSVNRKPVKNVSDFNDIVKELKPNDIVLLRLKRESMSFFRALRVPKEKKK